MDDNFRAVTWNVFAGSKASALDPFMKSQRKRGASVFVMQEAGGDDITQMCHDNGLETYCEHKVVDGRSQWRTAWDPKLWVELASDTFRASDLKFFSKIQGQPAYNYMARTILADRVGRTLMLVSYHTPAHVQHHDRPENRYKIMIDGMKLLGSMAEDMHTHAFLSGGDDNWDESRGIQTADVEPYLLGNAIGLRQVAAPSGTLGKRRIDDFRIKRGGLIKPVGDGWVEDIPSDHNLHGHEFQWLV